METFLLLCGIYASIILLYVTVVFLLAQLKTDNSIMDIFYGPAFMIATWSTMYLTQTYTLLSLTVGVLVSLWALRLSYRIAKKNIGKPEDARYATWRTAWSKRGQIYFVVRSFLQINLLQGITIVVVSLPIIICLHAQTFSLPFLYLGSLVFLAGLLYEAIADWQLDAFIARKKAGTEEATLMTQGLFYYSRRPNYFGEATLWWGLAIIALPLPFGYIALLGPITITFIVTNVTGPMLEKLFLEKYPEAYTDYIKTTNYFVPGKKKVRK